MSSTQTHQEDCKNDSSRMTVRVRQGRNESSILVVKPSQERFHNRLVANKFKVIAKNGRVHDSRNKGKLWS